MRLLPYARQRSVRRSSRAQGSRWYQWTVPRVAFSLSERLAAFHASQRDWHGQMAEAHHKHGHHEAEHRHRAAAAAHEAARLTPMDMLSARIAMRCSNRAEEASQAAGVKPSTGWPTRGA